MRKKGLKLLPRAIEAFLICLIRIYQLTLSYFIGRKCRFYPSCSEYTKLSIKKHGAVKGIRMGIARIAKCHPYGKNDVDFP